MEPNLPNRRDEFENPYAAPDSTFAPDLPAAELARIPFDIGDVLTWTWTLYKEQMGICILVVVGALFINLAIALGLNVLNAVLGQAVQDRTLLSIITILVTFGVQVVQIWLNIGANLVLLKVARRQPAVFADIFTGGRYVLTTILASLLMGICLAGPMVLGFLGAVALLPMIRSSESFVPLAILVVLAVVLIVFTVFIGIRFLQFYFVVIDRNAGVIASLRASWSLTKGRVPTLILVYLLQSAIVMAGLLACGFGLIFSMPLAALLLTVTYVALTGQSSAPQLQFLDGGWDQDVWKEKR